MRKKIYSIIELDENGNTLSYTYDKVMQVAIVLSFIPLMFRGHCLLFTLIELAVTILFVADYVLRWATADLRSGQSGIGSFVKYPFTLVAILDLITILPSLSYVNNSFRLLRTWRLLRVLRISKVFKYYEPLQMVIEVFRKKASVLLTVVGFALFYIFVTALFMFNVEQSTNPETGELFFENFFDAIY